MSVTIRKCRVPSVAVFVQKKFFLRNPFFYPTVKQCRRTIFSLVNGWFKDDNNQIINHAVSHAEKAVGYPTSYLSLRALLSDELSSIALHIRKLAQTKHPLLTTARGILFDSKHNIQSRGLAVLLLSKAISCELKEKLIDTNEAFQSQRSLAELTELIYIGFLIHRGIVDRRFLLRNEYIETQSQMELGNKMAVLSGDFLLANACVALSELKNSQVVSMMSSAIGDMSQGYFILPESGEFARITTLDDLPCSVDDWQQVTFLTQGSLLTNACKSSAELVCLSDEYGEICAQYGKHMMLAQQARLDVQRMNKNSKRNGKAEPASCELCALPVVILAEEKGGKEWLKQFVTPVKTNPNEYALLKNELLAEVSSYLPAVRRAKEVCDYHREIALQALLQLPDGEARKALEILTKALSSL